MAENSHANQAAHSGGEGGAPPQRADDHAEHAASGPDRRAFLASGAAATGAMAGGLAVSYGAFFYYAGEYLYPSEEGTAWMFVAEAAHLKPGQAVPFTSPTGASVVITRKPRELPGPLTAEDFIALSSVCPHLGCRVHWEPQNNRFFCPCHLGTFDPQGKPTGGPVLAANQALPEYPLMVEGGLLYINMPVRPVDEMTYRRG